MPDLDALAAQAASMPMGAGAGVGPQTRSVAFGNPVKFVTPKNSMLQFGVNDAGKAESSGLGGPAICGFAIPLITIVATFVLRLFLPIVVFLFGLWWMLRLRLGPQTRSVAFGNPVLHPAGSHPGRRGMGRTPGREDE
jgi:hypothetical protein